MFLGWLILSPTSVPPHPCSNSSLCGFCHTSGLLAHVLQDFQGEMLCKTSVWLSGLIRFPEAPPWATFRAIPKISGFYLKAVCSCTYLLPSSKKSCWIQLPVCMFTSFILLHFRLWRLFILRPIQVKVKNALKTKPYSYLVHSISIHAGAHQELYSSIHPLRNHLPSASKAVASSCTNRNKP